MQWGARPRIYPSPNCFANIRIRVIVSYSNPIFGFDKICKIILQSRLDYFTSDPSWCGRTQNKNLLEALL